MSEPATKTHDRKAAMYRRDPDMLIRDITAELGPGALNCADLTRRLFDCGNDDTEFSRRYSLVWQRLKEMLSLGRVRRIKTRQCVLWEVT